MIAAMLALLVVASPPPNVDSWQGVWPGEAFSDVVATNGEPLLVRQRSDGLVLTWNRLKNIDAYMIIMTRSSIVRRVSAFARRPDGLKTGLTDPFGVTVGDSVERLKARRGEPTSTFKLSNGVIYDYNGLDGGHWLYQFLGDTLGWIDLETNEPPPSSPANGQEDPNDGSNIEKAFVINARNEDEGVRFERYYASLAGPCSRSRNIGKPLRSSNRGRRYDRLDMTCARDNSKKSLFFDVTSFFRKH